MPPEVARALAILGFRGKAEAAIMRSTRRWADYEEEPFREAWERIGHGAFIG